MPGDVYLLCRVCIFYPDNVSIKTECSICILTPILEFSNTTVHNFILILSTCMQAHVVIPVQEVELVVGVVQVVTSPSLSISTRLYWLTLETGWQWHGRMWTTPHLRTGLECTLPPSVGQLMPETMLPLNGRYMDAVHDTRLQACRLVASLVQWGS